jgi:transposase
MTLLSLNLEEWEALETLATDTTDARLLRRVQALLWLAEGETVQKVATRLRVTRQAVYKWVACFQQRHALALEARLAPGQHTGRPRAVQGVIEPLIAAVIERDPRELGYRSTVWTAPLLRYYLREVHQLDVSRPSVSLAITRLRLRWKRPRHVLSRRPATWRQAKGGSSAVWRGGSGRFS